MTDYPLYGGQLPHVAGCETSKGAAEAAKPKAAILRAKCFEVVRAAGAAGVTCDEVEAATGLLHQSASARVRELVQLGHIVDAGVTRLTRSGRPARVYVVAPPTPAAKAYATTAEGQLALDPWDEVPA